MASLQPRRSTRARKQVRTYAEEQAEQEPVVIPIRLREKKAIPKVEDADDADFAIATLNNTNVKPQDLDSEEEFVAKPTKKRAKKSTRKESDGTQLFGQPLPGILIPFCRGRMRKQPKIYPIAAWRVRKPTSLLSEAAEARITREANSIPKLKPGKKEARLRSYVDELPEWYEKFLESAATQKMFILERTRDVESDCHANHSDCPFEELKIAGSSGNVYVVRISHRTTCTCPVGLFSIKGEEKQCKHILYVLHHVLRAPKHLVYQHAFLTSELKELFDNAPPMLDQVAAGNHPDGNRKDIDGECPICFQDFEDGDTVVWCIAACGNNIHKGCFDQWAKAKAKPTCPFCRKEWQAAEKKKLATVTVAHITDQAGERDRGGYLNVRDQLHYA